jgi:hypothetical protein
VPTAAAAAASVNDAEIGISVLSVQTKVPYTFCVVIQSSP